MDKTDIFMGFVGASKCPECGKETFAKDGIHAECKEAQQEQEEGTLFGQKILDCD
jgi:hypothetical protein